MPAAGAASATLTNATGALVQTGDVVEFENAAGQRERRTVTRTGAGGVGTGTGSGGSGRGSGGGGSGGVATRPSVVRGITNRDYPDDVSRYWPRGGAVFIAVRVLPNGRATDCKINRSIGIPAIDQWTCRLVEERAVFRPATDASGRPVAAWYGYIQREVGRAR